jgi:CubicO group peptidase (beta-lactamase class C family)
VWRSAITVLSLLLLAGPLSAAPPSLPDTPVVDAMVRDALKAWGVPGASVAVVRDGDLLYLKGHGVRQAGSDRLVTPDTVFPLASCSKAFTTTVMAMLAGDGKLAWDDPVRKHVDWFHLSDPLADSEVTLRDLVTHRTGLRSHDLLWYRAPWKQKEIVRRTGLLPLDRPFRTAFQYQSTMFTLAGFAAGSAAKCSWADLVRKRIFDPLEMTDASLTTTEAEKAADRAMPHRPGAGGKADVIAWYPQETPDPAGSVNASVRDLARWLSFHLAEGVYKGKRLVGAAALHETHVPQIVLPLDGINRDLNPETNLSSYGMGWRIQDYRGTLLLSHAGAIDGFRAQMILLPREHVGIAILCNMNQSRINLALGNNLIDLFLGLPKKDWNTYYLGVVMKEQAAAHDRLLEQLGKGGPDTKTSLPLSAYAGTYEHPAYGQARVTAEDGGLLLRWSSFRWPLEHYRQDTFTVTEDLFGAAVVTFAPTGDGGVAFMKLDEPFAVEFKKQP